MAVVGGPYSAGSVFVQVVPSFRNFQNRIKQEVEVLDKALGKEMEASGKKAGRAAGKAVAKELKDEVAKAQVGSDDIKVDVGAIRRKVQSSANEAARDLGGNSIFKEAVSDLFDISKAVDDNEDVDVTFLAEMLEAAAKKIEKIGANKISVEASMDASKALAKIKPQVKAIETAARGEIEFKAKADLSSAKATVVDSLNAAMREIGGNRQLTEARDRMADFRNSIINGDDIDLPKLRSTMEEVSAIMSKAHMGKKATWATHFEAPRAIAQIQRALDKIDPPVIEPEIDLTDAQKFKKSLEEGFEKSLESLGDERHIRKVRKKMEAGLKGIRAEPELDLARTRGQLDGLIREFASAAITAPTASAREKAAVAVSSLRGMRGDIDKRMPEITGEDLGSDQISIDLQNAIKKAIKAAGDSKETEAFRRQLKNIDVNIKMHTIGKREAIAELRQVEWAAKGISLKKEGKVSIEGVTEARRTYESLNSTLNKIGVDTNRQHNSIERFGHSLQSAGNRAQRAGAGVRVLGRAVSRVGAEFNQNESFLSRAKNKFTELGVSTLGVGQAVRRVGSIVAMVLPLIPLLAASIAGLTYALGAVAPAAAAAVGSIAVLGVGFSGVMAGVKALQKRDDAAPADISKAQKKALQNRVSELRRQVANEKRAEQAARKREQGENRVTKARAASEKADNRATQVGIDNARRLAEAQKAGTESVKRARESAAKANEQALKREADAQKRIARQVEEVREAERRLREAREEAKNKGKDIARDIKKNKLQEDAGVVALFDADVEYKSTMADGSATNREKELARIAVEEARMNLEDIRSEGSRLAKEQSEWDRTGVEGTEEVKSAKENVVSAVENQREAEAEAAETSKEVVQTRIEGERAVAEAIIESAERVRAVQEENAQRLAEAQSRASELASADPLSGSGTSLASESSTDSQRMLDDAIRQLENFDQLASSQAKVASEFDNMSAAGQRFARFIYGLGPGFRRLRDEIQSAMLPAAERAIRTFMDSPNSSTLARSMVAMAEGWGRLFEKLGDSLSGPAWGRFFDMMGKEGVMMQENYGTGFIYFLEGLAGLMTALAPSAVDLSKAFSDLMKRFADWANSPKGQKEIQDFMKEAKKDAVAVANAFVSFGKAIWDLTQYLAPLGIKMLEGLVWITEIDPAILKGIAAGFVAIAAAIAVMWVIANWEIALVAVVVAALVYLYQKFDWFRAAVDLILGVWLAHLKFVFGIVADILGGIGRALGWLGEKFGFTRDKSNEAAEDIKSDMEGVGDAAQGMGDRAAPAIDGVGESMAGLEGQTQVSSENIMGQWGAMGQAGGALQGNLSGNFTGIGQALQGMEAQNQVSADNMMGQWGEMGVAGDSLKTGLGADFRGIGADMNGLERTSNDAFGDMRGDFGATERQSDDMQRKMGADFNAVGSSSERMSSRVATSTNAMKQNLNGVKAMLPGLVQAFGEAASKIDAAMQRLRNSVASPLRDILSGVINNGLLKGFNELAGQMNATPAKPVTVGPKLDSTPVKPKKPGHFVNTLYTGGILPGYTPGRDVFKFSSPEAGDLHLSGGEGILRPEAVRGMGVDEFNRLNAAARSGGVAGVRTALAARQRYAFASGGIFAPVPGRINRHSRAQYPWANISGDYPVPMGTPIRAYMDGIVASVKRLATSYGQHIRINHPNGSQTLYAHMSKIIAGAVGQQVKGGQVIGLVGSTGNSSGPHLHFEHKGGHSFPGMGQGGGPTAIASSAPEAVAAFLAAPGETAAKWAGYKNIAKKPWIHALKGAVAAKAMAMVAKEGTARFAYGDEGATPVSGAKDAAAGIKDAAGHVAVRAALRASALKMGWWKPSDMNGLMNIVGRESSFNVSAKNPSSTARGLFQLLYEPGTRKPYGVHSLGEQIADGLGYIKGRYGSPGKAWDFWQSHHWYKDGGILPDFSGQRYNGSALRDTGGPLQPGITTVVNKTGKAEQVYTAEQHAAAQAALAATSRVGLTTGYNGPAVKVDVTGLSETQAANAMAGELNYQIRQINRRGRYS